MLAERVKLGKQTTAGAESGRERQAQAEEEHPELCGRAGDCVVQGTGFGSVKELTKRPEKADISRRRCGWVADATVGSSPLWSAVGDSEEKRCLGEIVLCRRGSSKPVQNPGGRSE